MAGITGAPPAADGSPAADTPPPAPPPSELLRPLAAYEAAVGGAW
jgi:hypothetical protein